MTRRSLVCFPNPPNSGNQTVQARVNTLTQIGPILSPEQREAYAKMMDHGPRRHGHMKRTTTPAQPS